MKKNVLLTLTALVVTLALSLFTAACAGVDATFKVTTEYNAEHGAVAVADADGNSATTFKMGERVVITVTPEDGYAVDGFKVNGADGQLNNGVYACYAASDILVQVTFKATDDEKDPDEKDPDEKDPDEEDPYDGKTAEEILLAAYDSVTTTFVADGQYIYRVEGADPQVNLVTTIFGEHAVNLIENDGDTGEAILDDVYVDVDGKLAKPTHTINNTIEYVYPTVSVDFSEYGNPFKLLTASDFAATDKKGVFALTTADKKDGAATALTGYIEAIADFKIAVADGKVTEIDILTERIKRGSGDSEYYYTATYRYDISDWGEAEVDADKIKPYATEAEHVALKNALAAMSLAKNYTVSVHEEELGYEGVSGDGYGDLDYDVYVTETAIYYDCKNWEEGYVEMTSGGEPLVYPFSYDPETETGKLYDAVKGFPTLASMRANFNRVNDFAPEIFELDDGGAYILRDDCYSYDNVRDVLLNFAEGLDQMRLYLSYTLDVGIALDDDGELYQVELYYIVSDAYIRRVLTYSAVDETVLPISISDDNFSKVSALDEYAGTYTDGAHTAVIDTKSIIIDGAPFTVSDYSIQYDLFEGVWNDETWYLTKQTKKQITLYYIGETEDDDIMYVLTSTAIDPVEIPDGYNGVWSKDGHIAAIAYDKIEYDGKMLTVLSDEGDNGVYAKDSEYTYRFFIGKIEDDDGNEVDRLTAALYVDGRFSSALVMAKDETVALIPEALVGTFEKYDSYYSMNVKATVGLTTVALEFDDQKPTVAVTAVTNDGYWEITLDVDGVEYFIQEYSYSSDRITLGSIEDRFNITLDRTEEVVTPPVTSIEAPADFYGEYEGEKNDVAYAVSISADGVIVKIGDGEAKAATVTDYDDEVNEIVLDIDGAWYCITRNYADETAIDFFNSDSSVYVTLARQGGDSVVIPEKFYGEYMGNDNGTYYYVIIDASGILLSIQGVETPAVVEEYGDYFGEYVNITVDGVAYGILSPEEADGTVTAITLACDATELSVILTRVE